MFVQKQFRNLGAIDDTSSFSIIPGAILGIIILGIIMVTSERKRRRRERKK